MQLKVWYNTKRDASASQVKADFEFLQQQGVSGVNFQFTPQTIAAILPFTSELELQIWRIMLCNYSAEIKLQHPDWYMVSRTGQSSCDFPPYVSYYSWLCPNQPAVVEYLLKEVEQLCGYSEISAIHLDYIRYPDVILPPAIQPQYGLQQHSEAAEYDFCYCRSCRQKFMEISGKDPLQLQNPQNNLAWLQFRYDSINNLVELLQQKISSFGKKTTAAVFPSPLLARSLVRQDWQNWDLAEYYLMLYHNFYQQNADWIGKICRFDRALIASKSKIFAGIFLPAIP
ncbi:MAG: hypothetical protein R6U84_10295, partial [Candidatus Cloacimonadales bacterium]